jgi:hypothetical protein
VRTGSIAVIMASVLAGFFGLVFGVPLVALHPSRHVYRVGRSPSTSWAIGSLTRRERPGLPRLMAPAVVTKLAGCQPEQLAAAVPFHGREGLANGF